MTPRTFVLLHVGCAAVGAALLWWFVLRDRPGEAVADSITAAAVAGYVELLAFRMGS